MSEKQIKGLKEKFEKHKPLVMNRVPITAKERFHELAGEFCNDYGMTLAHLIEVHDIYDNLIKRIERIESKLEVNSE